MTQPFFPSTISAQSRNNEFLTIKTVVRKTHQNNGDTGSSYLDKAVLAQGGGGGVLRGEGGQGTQKIVYQKWPDQIFPVVNFVFSHDGHFGLGGGGVVQGGYPPSTCGVQPF